MSVSHFLLNCAGIALIAGTGTVSPVAAAPVAAGSAAAKLPGRVSPAAPAAVSLLPLVADAAIRYGRLGNGMRYALRRNATPAKGASFRLRIGSGSLSEQEDQRGLMHFIEHMVFNGSSHVSEGEFAQKLERHGLSFGADVNAYTSYDETVYMLDLPETDADTIDTALFLFREVAGEATMADAAIDRERGVVLSEERLRSTPDARASEAQLDFYARNQLVAKRAPIGLVDVIRAARSDRFLKLYHEYYRPENAMFVAVGNFDPAELEAKLKAKFGDWRGVGPAGPKPKFGTVAPRGTETSGIAEPGVSSQLHLVWNDQPDLAPDSTAKRRSDLIEQLGFNVLNRRFGKLAQTDDHPFGYASVSHSTIFKSLSEVDVAVGFDAGKWQPALTATEKERRRFVDYGISRVELDREIADLRKQLQTAVAGQATRGSSSLANQIIGSMSQDRTYTTPADALARFDNYVEGLTPDYVNGIMKTTFRGQGPLIYVTGPDPVAGGNAAIAQAYDGASKLAVTAPVAPTNKQWGYTDFGPPGHVAERREIADLGTTFVRFDNGVRLTVRPSKVARNSIEVGVRIGNGVLDLPADKANASWLAQSGLIEGGLGKLTATEIDDTLVGKQYGGGFGVGEDSFVFGGSTEPDDLDTQMQVLAAYVTDPGFRPDGVERAKAATADQERQLQTSASKVLALNLPKLVYQGDKRFSPPTLPERLAMGIDDVRSLLAPLKTGSIEVLMVGDVTVADAIKQTAATFGALPPRPEVAPPVPPRATSFARPQLVTFTHQGRKDQAVAVVAWPTDDYFTDYHEFQELGALSAIMQLRMLEEFREKQGVTYAPGATRAASKAFPGFGYAIVSIEAPADKLGTFFTDVDKIARSLRDAPPSQDEFDRATRPTIEQIEHLRETNGFWIGALAGAQTDPRKLDSVRRMMPGLRSITPADVQRVAAKYLRDDQALRVKVVPADPVPPAK